MQRHGARRLTAQAPLAITKWTSYHNSLSTTPHLLHENKDHQLFCDLLEACKLSSDLKTAIETHARIIRFGYATHSSLSASLISIYVNCDRLNLAYQVINQVFAWTIDLVALNLVIENFMREGDYEIANKVFCKMPARDVVTWNSMIGGLVRNARFEDALRFFRAMLSSNVEPDKFTFASVITACARLGVLDHAQWVHDLMRSDVSIWNSMINGLAVHGLALDAITLFSRMEEENVLPDSITFLGILTACSHCGLVKEGRKYFDLMKSHYLIQPQLEHYGAMVDLLSRAGLLEEAYATIKAMPMEPDVIIWRALLSACRTYQKPELGEVAITNISRLESGDYVLLSNIYCSQKRWDSAQGAGDRSHPEVEAIYKILEGLIQRTKLEGFLPATELVMMDVSEEEKEGNLYYHSEKLALAYGIFKTCPGTEIRISKNLRICNDCHNWIKMVSRLLSRVIIVRDRIRFHRFEGGSCSCGDYW
ncbi:hypothetical protein GH714_025353 [Hevea brasiliensis]|uniref:DYW domain-containing protein n=1 Tax=Hevea brasiliensis TaxID=3981 RepID=A0A6A6MHY1_HEVBR|nr:hypothetical protein GH714_025353 [Hevea brasiliensis]